MGSDLLLSHCTTTAPAVEAKPETPFPGLWEQDKVGNATWMEWRWMRKWNWLLFVDMSEAN